MAQKTSQKILVAARGLFNKNRYGNVKLSEIASAVGISEGNIWYHFKDKRAILEKINEEFILAAHNRMQLCPDDGDVVHEFVDFLLALASEVRTYRFMYRDQADYGMHSQALLEVLPKIYERTFEQYHSFIMQMKTEGNMAIKDADIDDLCDTLVLILRYGLEYYRESSKVSLIGDGDVLRSAKLQAFVLSRFTIPEAYTRFEDRLVTQLEAFDPIGV